MSMNPKQVILSTDVPIPIIWIVDDINVETFGKTISTSFASTPFKAKLVVICKNKDIYLRNNIDTLFYRGARRLILTYIDTDRDNDDLVCYGESFVPSDAPFYLVLRDGVFVEKSVMESAVKFMWNNNQHDALVFKEAEQGKPDTILYDPSSELFIHASFMVCKRPLHKVIESGKVRVAASKEGLVMIDKKRDRSRPLFREGYTTN